MRFATVLCGDRGLGEDLVQDVLIRAHPRWDRIGSADSPFAYVRRMVVNEHLAWRRKWSRQIPTSNVVPIATQSEPAGHLHLGARLARNFMLAT